MKKKIEAIPFFSAVLTALCYLLFFIIWDYFPSVDKITIFQETKDIFWGLPSEINLPYRISRLWDIPTIFVITLIVITLFKYLKKPKHKLEESYVGVILGLFFGFIMGLWLIIKGGIGIDISFYFMVGIITGCLISFTISLFNGSRAGIRFSLLMSVATSLLIGFSTGLKTGFVIGLLTVLGLSLEMTMILGAVAITGGFLKYLFSENFLELIAKILKNELN